MSGRLVVHTARGVYEIPLTGDARTDALIEKWARRGTLRVAVLRPRGELALDTIGPAPASVPREERAA